MRGSLVPEIARSLAGYVETRRAQLVATVVRSTALAQPGAVAANAFTEALYERLEMELRTGNRETLDLWAGAHVQRNERSACGSIVLVACAVLSAAYSVDVAQSSDAISYLALRSSELEKRLSFDCLGDPTRPEAGAGFALRDEVVSSLLAAIEARDEATCEHSRAVGMWCGRIAKTLGSSLEEQTFAALGGTLHDVGKVATPAEILLKAGPLDAREWETMREHSEVGAKMLERIPSLAELAPVVRAHHERLDGRGYPDRLTGDAIPFVARIVAVADSFHAMISKRPYRRPLPVPQALDELRAGAGTQWDPHVIEAMLRIVQPSRDERARRAAPRALKSRSCS